MLQEISLKLTTGNLHSDEIDNIYFTIDRAEHILAFSVEVLSVEAEIFSQLAERVPYQTPLVRPFRKENEHYVGPLPPFENDPDGMSTKEGQEFLRWYEELTNAEYV